MDQKDQLVMMSSSACGCAERVCEAVIETLKELKTSTTGPLTPKLLHEALSKKKAYLELLAYESAASDTPSENELGRQEARIKRLKDFRIELLSEVADLSTYNFYNEFAELRKNILVSRKVDEILALNDELMELVKLSTRKVSAELQEFTALVTDIGKNLIEMENDLKSSFTLNRENYVNSNAFSDAIEQHLQEMVEATQKSQDLSELKKFLFLKLSTIKGALEKKRKFDEIQLQKAAKEAGQLNRTIKKMKTEMNRAQNRANILEKESLMDPLTGTHNRRAYEKHIKKEMCNYKQYEDQVFSMLLIDIDNFKSVNDTYGHSAGDRCLEEISKLIKLNLRGTDFFARFGGEEFVVILPETDQEGALTVAEKLRKCIENARFSYRGQRLYLTICIGCTALQSSDTDAKTLFNRADAALYQAKESGRNRVVASM
jgi:diguanylate cyclase